MADENDYPNHYRPGPMGEEIFDFDNEDEESSSSEGQIPGIDPNSIPEHDDAPSVQGLSPQTANNNNNNNHNSQLGPHQSQKQQYLGIIGAAAASSMIPTGTSPHVTHLQDARQVNNKQIHHHVQNIDKSKKYYNTYTYADGGGGSSTGRRPPTGFPPEVPAMDTAGDPESSHGPVYWLIQGIKLIPFPLFWIKQLYQRYWLLQWFLQILLLLVVFAFLASLYHWIMPSFAAIPYISLAVGWVTSWFPGSTEKYQHGANSHNHHQHDGQSPSGNNHGNDIIFASDIYQSTHSLVPITVASPFRWSETYSSSLRLMIELSNRTDIVVSADAAASIVNTSHWQAHNLALQQAHIIRKEEKRAQALWDKIEQDPETNIERLRQRQRREANNARRKQVYEMNMQKSRRGCFPGTWYSWLCILYRSVVPGFDAQETFEPRAIRLGVHVDLDTMLKELARLLGDVKAKREEWKEDTGRIMDRGLMSHLATDGPACEAAKRASKEMQNIYRDLGRAVENEDKTKDNGRVDPLKVLQLEGVSQALCIVSKPIKDRAAHLESSYQEDLHWLDDMMEKTKVFLTEVAQLQGIFFDISLGDDSTAAAAKGQGDGKEIWDDAVYPSQTLMTAAFMNQIKLHVLKTLVQKNRNDLKTFSIDE